MDKQDEIILQLKKINENIKCIKTDNTQFKNRMIYILTAAILVVAGIEEIGRHLGG